MSQGTASDIAFTDKCPDVKIPPGVTPLNLSDRALIQSIVNFEITPDQIEAISPYFERLRYLLPYIRYAYECIWQERQ